MEVNCKYCGKIFFVKLCRLKYGRGKYCSRVCYCKAKIIPNLCKYCGRDFRRSSHDVIDFCSRECRMRGSFGDFVRKWVSDRKKLPHPNLGKPMYSMRGKNHPNWKGGSTPKLLQIRHSLKYKNWRRAVFERDNYTCLWCGARSSKSNPVYLNADHIKPFALYPETRFDLDNGRTLCVECHKKTDTYLYKLNNKRKWTNGNNVQVTYTVSTAGSSVTAGEPPATTDKNE